MAEDTSLLQGKSSSALVGEEIAYPKNIRTIPYASYFKIMRWEYKKGIQEAAAETGSRDVLAMSQKGASGFVNDLIESSTTAAFGDVETKANNSARNIKDIDQKIKKGFNKQKKMFRTEHNKKIEAAKEANDYSGFNYPIKLQDGTEVNNPEELQNKKNEAKKAQDSVQSLYWLPMPNDYSYKYGANWDNKFKLGTMAKFASDAGAGLKQSAITGAIGGAVTTITEAANVAGEGMDEGSGGMATGILSGAASAAVNPLGSTDTFDTTNLLGLAGLAPNENAIQLFSNMTMRSFTFSFDFFARSSEEAKLIDNLIKNFKIGMHPYADKQGNGAVLGFPDVWVIQPQFNSVDGGSVKSIDHPQMPSTKLCALIGMNVNTTPANQFTTTDTGEFPIQTVTLDFKETTALTQADFKGGDF